MFEIDDNLLNELGLGALAGQEREEFKDYVAFIEKETSCPVRIISVCNQFR